MSSMVRNVSVQQGQAQVAMSRPQAQAYAPMSMQVNSVNRSVSSELTANPTRNQRTSSPKAWTGSQVPLGGSAPHRQVSPDETFVGANTEKTLMPKTAPGPGAVRSASGSQNLLSPPRTLAGRGGGSQVEVECAAGLHYDCPTCMDTRRRGFVTCRLPCGHTIRAQIVDTDLPAGCWGGGGSGPPGGAGARSESPPLLASQSERRERAPSQELTSPPPRSIMRQVSGIRNPVPSVGIPHGNHSQPPAPLSPPRGPASPSSPQQTPGTMYRKATSSLTSFNIMRETSGQPPNVEVSPSQQMTSRSSGGGGGLGGSSQGGAVPDRIASGHLPPSREASTRDNRRGGPRELVRTEPFAPEARRQGALDLSIGGATVAEVVTDSRGDVLHRMCNVILLSPHSNDKEQQLKVRGQIIGTYWDERDIGPTLDHAGEVQVMVTFVDASERSASLLFPSKCAATFGDTETAEGNIIKWRAALCKVGKKFS